MTVPAAIPFSGGLLLPIVSSNRPRRPRRRPWCQYKSCSRRPGGRRSALRGGVRLPLDLVVTLEHLEQVSEAGVSVCVLLDALPLRPGAPVFPHLLERGSLHAADLRGERAAKQKVEISGLL